MFTCFRVGENVLVDDGLESKLFYERKMEILAAWMSLEVNQR